jgi:hypothetical protein
MSADPTDVPGPRLPFLGIPSSPDSTPNTNSARYVNMCAMNAKPDGGSSGSSVWTKVDVCLHNQVTQAAISEDDLFSDDMNIFVLSDDPVAAGQMLCDKHVCKMSIEYAQLLCNAHWHEGTQNPMFNGHTWGPTHVKHPCSLWVMDSICNYQWLLALTLVTWDEYRYRYDRTHACDAGLRKFLSDFPPLPSFSTQATAPPQCMPDDYRIAQTVAHQNRWRNAVDAYRDYYVNEKYQFAKWTKRLAPLWYVLRTHELAFDATTTSAATHGLFKVIEDV